MKRIFIATAMSLCVVSLAAIASADTLILRDGTRDSRQGRERRRADDYLRGCDRRVASLQRDPGRCDRIRAASQQDAAVGTSGSSRRLEVLPSGTDLTVRTAEDIDSSTAVVNQTFAAIVERNILGESEGVAIPAGSHAVLVVREVSSGGTTGSPDIVLDLQSITVAGRRYLVSSGDMRTDSGTGLGKNKRTAETVGGGAALGHHHRRDRGRREGRGDRRAGRRGGRSRSPSAQQRKRRARACRNTSQLQAG